MWLQRPPALLQLSDCACVTDEWQLNSSQFWLDGLLMQYCCQANSFCGSGLIGDLDEQDWMRWVMSVCVCETEFLILALVPTELQALYASLSTCVCVCTCVCLHSLHEQPVRIFHSCSCLEVGSAWEIHFNSFSTTTLCAGSVMFNNESVSSLCL